jgi:hypothetical protein
MNELAELIPEIGDVRFDSVVVDPARHQISAKLEDGRTLRATVVIT